MPDAVSAAPENTHPDALPREGYLVRLAVAFTAWAERWFPDAFIFVAISTRSGCCRCSAYWACVRAIWLGSHSSSYSSIYRSCCSCCGHSPIRWSIIRQSFREWNSGQLGSLNRRNHSEHRGAAGAKFCFGLLTLSIASRGFVDLGLRHVEPVQCY
jgi:hypothetical protein